MHHLWFYKYQHDNRVRSKLFVACQRWWFQWRFAAILENCAPNGEMYNYCTSHIIKENYENFLIHRCNYVLLSEVYCVWQVVETPKTILNNPVHLYEFSRGKFGKCVNAIQQLIQISSLPSVEQALTRFHTLDSTSDLSDREDLLPRQDSRSICHLRRLRHRSQITFDIHNTKRQSICTPQDC